MRSVEQMDIDKIAAVCEVSYNTIRNDLKWLETNGYDLGKWHRDRANLSKSRNVQGVSDDEQVRRLNNKIRALELARDGVPLRTIAQQLGVKYETVKSYVEAALTEVVIRNVDALRQLSCQRLDRYLEMLKPKIEKGDDKAINAAIRCEQHRADLLGLRAPIKIEADVREETEQDRELKDMINSAKAKMAVQQDQIARQVEAGE